MTKYLKVVIIILSVFATSFVSSQTEEVIDLADNYNIEQNVKSGTTLNFIIKNLLPNTKYSISVEKRIEMLQVLNIEPENKKKPMSDSDCPIPGLLIPMDTLKSEKKLADFVNQLENLLSQEESKILGSNEDSRKCSEVELLKAKEAIKKTVKVLIPQKLEQGELLEVTISRKKYGTENETVVWKRTYRTGKRGKWLTTYGFTFISQSFKKQEAFFTEQIDSTFVITPLNQRSKLSFVPSIFFTWLPYSDINKAVSWSLTGGLGYDLEAPTVFLGANLLYNHNLGLSVGIAAHQQDFLNGRYNEGDVLLENLAMDQLNEKLYSLNPYISLNFRFGASPLKQENTETE